MGAAPPFELFGISHLVSAAVTLAVAFAVPLAARRLPAGEARVLGLVLAAVLVVYRTGWTIRRVVAYGDPLEDVIPLGICPLLFYLCSLAAGSRWL